MINNMLFKHNTKDCELMITKDSKNRPVLYVGLNDTPKKVLVKKFIGEWQYKQFLIEAVCLRLQADKKSVEKARDSYVSISKFLKDESNEKVDF